MKKLSIILMAFSSFISCKKESAEEDMHTHNVPETDTTFPAIVLNSPIENAVFHNGDAVFITGSVSDNELHSGLIFMENDSTSFIYMNQNHYVH